MPDRGRTGKNMEQMFAFYEHPCYTAENRADADPGGRRRRMPVPGLSRRKGV
jgi:hypothetical protein